MSAVGVIFFFFHLSHAFYCVHRVSFSVLANISFRKEKWKVPKFRQHLRRHEKFYSSIYGTICNWRKSFSLLLAATVVIVVIFGFLLCHFFLFIFTCAALMFPLPLPVFSTSFALSHIFFLVTISVPFCLSPKPLLPPSLLLLRKLVVARKCVGEWCDKNDRKFPHNYLVDILCVRRFSV